MKSLERFTAEQREAINAKGLVMVSASAGSGKTTALIERIKKLVIDGVPLRRMLILVYNNATADELREKLRNELFECACETSGEESELFRSRLDELPMVSIGTIHSFCRTLIRRNFDELGIDPDFKVLDKVAHNGYMSRALDTVLDRYAQNSGSVSDKCVGQADTVFSDLTSVFEFRRTEENLRDNIKKLFELMDVQPDKEEFVRFFKGLYEDRTLFDNIIYNDAARVMVEVVECCNEILPKLYETKQESYVNNVTESYRAAQMIITNDRKAILRLAADGMNLQKARKKDGDDEDAVELAKRCTSTVGDCLKLLHRLYGDSEKCDLIFEQNKRFALKLLEITLAFDEELSRQKKEDNVLSFGDLEHYAAELIRNGEDFSKDFDHVFVDEYQDVNPAQEFIISHMVGENAFMVGDVKQSIYGFRLADPTIFLRRQQQYEEAADRGEGTRPISFRDNFRSENQILEFVNGIFDAVMTQEYADVDYKNTARFNEAPRKEGSVQIHLFAIPPQPKTTAEGLYSILEHPEDDRAEDSVDSEARFIAGEIEKLRGRAVFHDRKLSYGDFAVLFRKRSEVSDRIIEVLKEEGIPIDDGSFTVSADRPENELISFLTVLDNPRQDFAFVGYMLSYLGGYNENELASIATLREKNQDFYDAVLARSKGDDALATKLKHTLSRIEEYRLKASFKSVNELLHGIISDTCYEAYLLSKGEAEANAVMEFVSVAGADENVSLGTFLRSYKSEGVGQEKRSSGGDRVHISTYHGYKGLEIPVVFVSNINPRKSGARRTSDITLHNGGALGLSYFDIDNKEKITETVTSTAVAILTREREYKEEMRLLYVALTRAQKYMYLTGCMTYSQVGKLNDKIALTNFQREETPLDFIYTALRKGTLKANIVCHTDAVRSSRSTARSLPISAVGGEYVGLIRESQSFVYPHRSATSLAMKYSVSALDSVDDESTVRVYEEKANIGTAYHRVMQYIDFETTSVEGVAETIDDMVNSGLLSEEEKAVIRPFEIVRALNTDVMSLARKSECLREQPFMMYVPAKDVLPDCEVSERVLVQGVIDLLITGESTILVDYKYSALRNDEAKEKYKKQLNLYKMAAETAFCKKIDRIILLSLKTGQEIAF